MSSSGATQAAAPARTTVVGAKPELGAPVVPVRQVGRGYLVAKRAFDVTSAVLGLVLVAPLLAVIAVVVKLSSPGPVLFRQRRPGFRCEPFWILKFRTMTKDAEERLAEVLPLNREPDHSLIRIPEDPRVTMIGRILRRTSLDELPQLINVVRGEMSLVGPRPISRPIPDERGALRLEAMPGLTGLWQISGRKDTDRSFMLQKDMEYLAKRGFWYDLGIVARTIPAVFRRNGAD